MKNNYFSWVEKVQRPFAKRLNGLRHLPYSDRLQVLASLERRRLNHDLIIMLVYKIIHGLTNCSLSHNLTLQQFYETRAHPYKLVISFLANVNSRSRSLYAIARPSVVCL